MAKFDQEDLLESVRQIMDESLNARITAIEAEKTAKGKTLKTPLKLIPTNGYYEQTWSDKILQTSPAIFYGVEEISALPNGDAVAKTYKVFCEVILVDNGQTNDAHKRIGRYARALEEIFAESFADAIGGGRVKVEQVRPLAFKIELDSDHEIKVGGVLLTISLV